MSLPYLDMISKTLRKYSPLAFLNCMVKETYEVSNSNLVFEKGNVNLHSNPWPLRYDPKYFPDTEKFDLERFNRVNKHNMPACVYLPYGDGPHACIGENFLIVTLRKDCQSLAKLK